MKQSSWWTGETLSVLRFYRETHGEGERGVQLADPPILALPHPIPSTSALPAASQLNASTRGTASRLTRRTAQLSPAQVVELWANAMPVGLAMEFWTVSYSAKEDQSHSWVGFEPRSVGLECVFICVSSPVLGKRNPVIFEHLSKWSASDMNEWWKKGKG